MELHEALKKIVEHKGRQFLKSTQVINYLYDYNAFNDIPAAKLIFRDIIVAGFLDKILSLSNKDEDLLIKYNKIVFQFINSCGYKENLAMYVFESLAFALDLSNNKKEPEIKSDLDFDSFFDIPKEASTQKLSDNNKNNNQSNKNSANSNDLYIIALTFFNEGKTQQAKSMIEKAIGYCMNLITPSKYFKLLGDINISLNNYIDAIKSYNEFFITKSKEENCSLDEIRSSLQNHLLKNVENIVFNYNYCLLKLNKITDNQWLSIVKAEARFGLIDAIKYCAENGVDPIDSHIDIYFNDINQLIDGDFLYCDGTFAHEKSESKQIIASIRLVETFDYEKAQGWNHGYIIPFEIAKNKNQLRSFYTDLTFEWSSENINLPFPHSHYSIDDINHWDEIKTICSELFIKINNFDKYPAFKAVRDYHINMPLNIASDWFLPSIHHIKKINNKIKTYGDHTDIAQSFWTSSQSNENMAISYHCGYSLNPTKYINHFGIAKKDTKYRVLPIAVF